MTIEQEYKDLEIRVVALLNKVEASIDGPSSQQIQELEWYVGKLSKIAYGNNKPELVSREIYNLIAWCDHIHEDEIKQQFAAALRTRPLLCPVWSRG